MRQENEEGVVGEPGVIPTLLFTTISDKQSVINPYRHISDNRVQLVDHLLPWNDQEVIDYGDELAPELICNTTLELGLHQCISIANIGGTTTFHVLEHRKNVFILESEDKKKFSLKIQDPPHPWEYYLAKQIQNRVAEDLVYSRVISN